MVKFGKRTKEQKNKLYDSKVLNICKFSLDISFVDNLDTKN